MTSDLRRQTHDVFSEVDAFQDAIDLPEIVALAERVAIMESPGVPSPTWATPRTSGRPWWRSAGVAAAAAAIATLVLVGGMALLAGGGSGTDPANTTTLPMPSTTSVPTSSTVPVEGDAQNPTVFPPDAVLWGVASNEQTIVAVGQDVGYCCWTGVDGNAAWEGSAAVWTSTDGLSWDRVPHDEDVFGPGQVMRSVVWTSFGFVAAGEDEAMWDDENGTGGAAFWISPDGKAWSRVPEAGIDGDTTGIWELLVRGQRLYALAWASTLVSDDGVTWTREPVAWLGESVAGGGKRDLEVVSVPDGFLRGDVFSMIEADGGYLALGRGPNGPSAGLYRSSDGISWTADPVFGPSVAPGKVIHGMTGFDGRIIGVGAGADGAVAEPVLVSPPDLTAPRSDAGLIGPDNWTLLLVDESFPSDIEKVAEELRSEPQVLDVMVVPPDWQAWYAATGIDVACLPGLGCGEGVVLLLADNAPVYQLEAVYERRFGVHGTVND